MKLDDLRRTAFRHLRSLVRSPAPAVSKRRALAHAAARAAWVVAFTAVTAAASPSVAQVPAANTPSPRLTVRPDQDATGTETAAAGVHALDSLPNYLVYVPESCVGKRRVPLVAYLHGGGGTSKMVLDEQRDMADKYGMILLMPEAPDGWDALYHSSYPGFSGVNKQSLSSKDLTSDFPDVRNVDRALKYVLHHYAIDPGKIAMVGFSDGASYALFLGRNNENVFSRVIGLSPFEHFDGSAGTRNAKTQFLVAGGIGEDVVDQAMSIAHELRDEGHDGVETVLALRVHTNQREDNDYVWGWLARGWGWKGPGGVEGTAPHPVPSDDPVLTADALAKFTAWWSAFMSEPDSIKTAARKANQEYVTMTVGQVPVTVVKADLRALAAKYPSVAADVERAGLSVAEAEAIRIALIRAAFTRASKQFAGTVPASSVPAKNLEFMEAHPQEIQKLESMAMWTTQ